MKRISKYMKRIVPFCLFLVALLSSGAVMAQEEVVSEVATAVSEESSAGFSINAVDTIWVLLAAMLVFFMQPGFALVEAGMTRTKNTANILMKNFLDFSAGSVLYWICGFSIMFGAGAFLGWDGFGIGGVENPCPNLPKEGYFIFQTVF